MHPLPVWEAGRGGKKECEYEDVHESVCLELKVSWPVPQDYILTVLGDGLLSMPPRSREVVLLAHLKFPLPDDCEAGFIRQQI